MAIGIVRQIASGSHQQVQIPSGNYPWPTIRILNPNDGVIYVKQNQDITSTGYGSWDYKVPSQSFGLLPGEGQGWQSVGLYYLDQSGSGANGEVSIYLTQQNIDEPVFQSIGRAIVSQTTSMDIVQGSQPANPGAGISRIWADPSGHLNILGPTGSNNVVLDSTNYGTFSIGGDLYNTISNAHIGLRNGNAINMYDTSGVAHAAIYAFTDNTFLQLCYGGVSFRWANQANNVELMTLTNAGALSVDSGALTVYGPITTTNGTVYFADVNHAVINSGGNMIYFCGSGYSHYFWQTGGVYATLQTGPINIQTGTLSFPSTGVTISGAASYLTTNVSIANGGSYYYFQNNTAVYLAFNSPYIYASHSLVTNGTAVYLANNGGIGMTWDGTNMHIVSVGQLFINTNVYGAGSIMAQGAVSTQYAFACQNAAATYGQGYANAWINASSKDFKKNIIPIGNPLGILLNPALRGVEYDHDWTLEAIDGVREAISGTTHHIGFVADDWLPHVPEIVAVDKTGKPEGMDYARVTSLLWEALREYIDKTDKRLAALEPVV